MDIDATLRELRDLSGFLNSGDREGVDANAERMCELDAHLQHGGMLPLAWKWADPKER